MTATHELTQYNAAETYRWNYEHSPEAVEVDVPAVPGSWTFCGMPVPSPLGVPAGPLLNGRWVLYYASLGFDVLTYKTVRSIERECYALPNLKPVRTGQLKGMESELSTTNDMQGSWAVSFGMPSASPDAWRADIEATRSKLPKEKILSVSVVGSIQPDWSLEDLADDYAQCAKWAVDSGANCIEANFSCPNVSTCDGQLYQQPESAALVAQRVRAAIGNCPFIVKIGHLNEPEEASALLEALRPHINAIASTNSVATTVRNAEGELLFDGEKRGICGDATREASLEQTRLFAGLVKEADAEIKLIGVGGISTANHVRDYLNAGAEATHIATAAMVDPLLGVKIRRELAKG